MEQHSTNGVPLMEFGSQIERAFRLLDQLSGQRSAKPLSDFNYLPRIQLWGATDEANASASTKRADNVSRADD